MATTGRGSGIVGYNVQSAVDAEHHLIVAHDVVMTGSDRQQLSAMAARTKDAMGVEALDVLADRGYFSGEEIRSCETMGVTAYVPKPIHSTAKSDGRFGKQDFVYLRAPAGSNLTRLCSKRPARYASEPILGKAPELIGRMTSTRSLDEEASATRQHVP